MEQRVSLVTLGVSDVAASAAFYERLGWTRAAAPDGLAAFDLIAQTLGLYPRDALASEAGLTVLEGTGHPGMTMSYNTRDRDEVDAVMESAQRAGGQLLKHPAESAWGGYHGFFADPDGYVWEIAFNPFSTLGPNGEFQWDGAA